MTEFVILYQDGRLRIARNREVSDLYDMADCDYMEDVREILAVSESGDLMPVTVDSERHRINDDQECPFRYAQSDIYAGTRRVGVVTWTDH